MKKQTKVKNTKNIIGAMFIIAVLSVSALSQGGLSHAATISELRDQANALQNQINQNNQKATQLAGEADTLKGKK